MFSTYLSLGFEHILDWEGYDHILFVLTLCSIYTIKEWKKVLILVTAFTIGHSLTLALSAMNIFTANATIIEILIPTTIILTALYNIWQSTYTNKENIKIMYFLTLCFGLIHGMGFSYFFKALLSDEESLISALLPFNIGVELGQIIVVGLALALSHLFVQVLGLKHKYWNYIISGLAIVVSTSLLLDRI